MQIHTLISYKYIQLNVCSGSIFQISATTTFFKNFIEFLWSIIQSVKKVGVTYRASYKWD